MYGDQLIQIPAITEFVLNRDTIVLIYCYSVNHVLQHISRKKYLLLYYSCICIHHEIFRNDSRPQNYIYFMFLARTFG